VNLLIGSVVMNGTEAFSKKSKEASNISPISMYERRSVALSGSLACQPGVFRKLTQASLD
jgi:hypothetical protein